MRLVQVLLSALVAATSHAQVKGDPAKGREISATACAACHGADGNSPVPSFPKLAGLDAAYLLKQMQDFKNNRRASDVMAPFAAALSADAMADVSAFFAGQKPLQGKVSEPALLDAGRKMWFEGNPASGVAACSSCHGDKAQGDARSPRLAGQHADYTVDQLIQFRQHKRRNDKRQMHAVAERMVDVEMKAVAAYTASLP